MPRPQKMDAIVKSTPDLRPSTVREILVSQVDHESQQMQKIWVSRLMLAACGARNRAGGLVPRMSNKGISRKEGWDGGQTTAKTLTCAGTSKACQIAGSQARSESDSPSSRRFCASVVSEAAPPW